MHVGVFPAQVVRIVGEHHRESELVRELKDPSVDLVLALDAVVLNLEVIAIGKRAGIELRRLFGPIVSSELEVLRHFARETRAEDDDALVVLREDLVVESGFPVEALRVSAGCEPDKVPVAREIARQEHEMCVLGRGVLGPLLLPSIAVRDVGLEAEDRLDLLLPGLLLELPGPVKIAVIGDGERGHAHGDGLADQVVDPVGSVEERILAMAVQVNERHRAVRRFLPGFRSFDQRTHVKESRISSSCVMYSYLLRRGFGE